jgi:hypothetical protein
MQYNTLALLLDMSCIPVAPWQCIYCSISPSVICLTDVRNRENFPGWVPPSSVLCRHCVKSHPAHLIAMLCFVLHCLLYIYCFLPPLFPIDPRDHRRRRCCVRLRRRLPDHFNRASRQAFPPSLITQISPIFYLPLALE